MPPGVGEGFLDDPVRGELDVGSSVMGVP